MKLHSTMAPNLTIPRKGYIIHLLVEGSPIGATYFDRLPLNMPPLYAYQPKSLRVFNKLLITKTEEVKKNYKSLNVYPVISMFSHNKTFVYDITPYMYYMRNKLEALRYVEIGTNFMQNTVTSFDSLGNEQILLYIVDSSILGQKINMKDMHLFNLLYLLRKMQYMRVPYSKIVLYSVSKNQFRVIYDKNETKRNTFQLFFKFIRDAINTRIIDEEEEEEKKKTIAISDIRKSLQFTPKQPDANNNQGMFGKIKNFFGLGAPQQVPTQINKNSMKMSIPNQTIGSTSVVNNRYNLVKKEEPPKPIIKQNVIIDRGDNQTEDNPIVKQVILPVAKKDPIKAANDNSTRQRNITQSDIDSAVREISKSAKSLMNNFNINTNILYNRLNALTRAKPDVAVKAVDSVNSNDKQKQMDIAQAAVSNTKVLKNIMKTIKPGDTVELTPDLEKQENTVKELGYDKDEDIDEVNNNKVVDTLIKNNISMAIARRHKYQEKIVNDIFRSVSGRLSDIGYKVQKVWFTQSLGSDTEMYKSDFDIVNIKCITTSRKTITLKFRVPAIHEDRYVVSGGLKWFFPTIIATLPIFIVKKHHSQIRTNYSSISFFYGIFNKQEDVRCFVGGVKIPLVLLFSLILGVEGVLRYYNINHMMSDRKLRGKTCYLLADDQWLVCDFDQTNVHHRVIETGLRLMFRRYKLKNITSTQEAFNCLKEYTGAAKSEYVLRQCIKYIVDVQTEGVLKSNQLPYVLKDIIPYCADLAISGKVSDKLSIDNVYLRTTDIITTAIEKGIDQGISNFKRKHLYDPNKEISVDSGFVTKFFRDQGALQQLQEQNPVEEVSNYAAVRIAGPGGLPNIEAIMPKDRAVRISHFGNLDPADTSEGDPGTRIFLSLGHLYDAEQHGFMAMEPNEKNTHIMGPALSCTPYVDADDQARCIMAASQARQAVPMINSEPPIVGTGAEAVIPAMCSSTFAKKANASGVVQYADDKVIIVKGDDNRQEIIDIRPKCLISGSGKNAAIEYKSLVKAGDRVNKFQILASNQFIKPTLTQGVNALCCYMSYMGYNYEDGFIVSESFAKKVTSTHNDKTEVTLLPNDQIEIFPKIGQTFKEGDTILRIKKSIVGDMALSDDYEIIAPNDCKVVNTEFFPNGDPNQIIDLINHTEQYYAQADSMISKAGGKKFFDKKAILANVGKYSDHGEVFKGNKVIIELLSYMPAKLGDKLANRHGGKGVITKILPDNMMPRLPDGRNIEVIYPNLCVIGRMNVGQLHELASAQLMVKATETLEQLYNKNAGRTAIENFIIDLYQSIDGTENKMYSAKIAQNLRSMNSSEFDVYVKDAIKSKLKLLAAPFQGDSIDQIIAASKKFGAKLSEYLYIPELGPNVRTQYPVAVGIMYFQRLEQIAELKSHARNIGRVVKTTMNPTRGKARLGGQRMGEMDTWCLLSYGTEGKEIIKQMYAVSADNQEVKRQVISDIIRNGSADITTEVKLSGAGEYFNAVITGMGIDING